MTEIHTEKRRFTRVELALPVQVHQGGSVWHQRLIDISLTGVATDQNGKRYYITKNSWGTKDRGHEGHIYMSEAYVRAKTIAILLHRGGLPETLCRGLAKQ